MIEGSKVSGTSTTFSFNLTTTNPIPAGGTIVISNPGSYTFAFDATQGCGAAASSPLGICTISGNTITVPVTTTIPGGTTLTLPVGNFTIPNPPAPGTSFTI